MGANNPIVSSLPTVAAQYAELCVGACGDVEDHDVNAAYILDYLPVCPLGVLETGRSLGSGATRKTSQGFSGAITATAKFSCLIG
jgi:hypothetical protein